MKFSFVMQTLLELLRCSPERRGGGEKGTVLYIYLLGDVCMHEK